MSTICVWSVEQGMAVMLLWLLCCYVVTAVMLNELWRQRSINHSVNGHYEMVTSLFNGDGIGGRGGRGVGHKVLGVSIAKCLGEGRVGEH